MLRTHERLFGKFDGSSLSFQWRNYPILNRSIAALRFLLEHPNRYVFTTDTDDAETVFDLAWISERNGPILNFSFLILESITDDTETLDYLEVLYAIGELNIYQPHRLPTNVELAFTHEVIDRKTDTLLPETMSFPVFVAQGRLQYPNLPWMTPEQVQSFASLQRESFRNHTLFPAELFYSDFERTGELIIV